ncbi:MAG: DUF4157 domain-containing protein, partial [Jaaginema sp. PMC 1080.18]|nr:DUF4157 domain-containing protein [Jaaginema sp. PMC 1080.18]
QTKPDSVQREDAEEEELQTKPDSVQREDAEEEELQMKPTLQRMGAEGGPVSDDIETEIQSARGGGQALAPDLQAQMGQAMGADFSGVRVHTDARADVLNRSVGARAFTTGQDLFFKQGEYQPGSKNGQELIAHELTHVKQQNGNTISRKITPEEYKGSNHDTQELKDAYNAAWEHLWPSPQARLIYEVVDSHPKDIKILVGWNEGSVATENEVKWNPSESYFHTTETTQEMYMANNGDVTLDENNVQSQTSSALTLMHELGHVKQRIEAQEAQEAAGTAKGGSRVGGAKKANWEHSLDRIVSKVMDRCKSYMGQDAFLNDDLNPDKAGKGSALERDNVTRHERPVGQEVGEASRPSYQNSAPEDFVTDDPNDEIRQQVTLHRQETLVEQVVHNTPQLGKGGKQADEDIWTVKTWLTDVANTLKQLKVKKKLEKSRDEDVAAIELMIASLQQLEDKDQLRLGEIGEEMKEEKEPDIPKW